MQHDESAFRFVISGSGSIGDGGSRFHLKTLFFCVAVLLKFKGALTEVDSSQLESKIFNGKPASNGEYKYIASLQLDKQHICSSGLFKKGFLLTTAECSWRIENGMRHKGQTATAVLGDINLQKGKRVRILKAAYSEYFIIHDPLYLNNFRDLGVIMVR